jgi:glucose/arabinose dehydrogenase
MSHRQPRRLPAIILSAILLLGTLVGCDASQAQVTGTPTADLPTETPSATPTAPPDLARVQLKLQPFVHGLYRPVSIAHANDGSGRLYIMEQSGHVKVTVDASGKLASQFFLNLTAKIKWGVELGLLGLAFDPQFKTNGVFYISYSNLDGNTVLARYHIMPNNPLLADPASEQILLLIKQPQPFRPEHKSGMLNFGPDGYLYMTVGDGGAYSGSNGQRLDTILGKIIRIDVHHTSLGKPYAIPPDNPFVNRAGTAPEIWAYGVRNAWRFSFDRKTGDMFIGDVGEVTYDEVDFQPASSHGGENYGWNVYEGYTCEQKASCPPANYVAPITAFKHTDGQCAMIGGYVYRGMRSPALNGIYIYGDWCSGHIFGLSTAGLVPGKQVTNRLLLDTDISISTFGEDEAGEMYVADLHSDLVYRLSA